MEYLLTTDDILGSAGLKDVTKAVLLVLSAVYSFFLHGLNEKQFFFCWECFVTLIVVRKIGS